MLILRESRNNIIISFSLLGRNEFRIVRKMVWLRAMIVLNGITNSWDVSNRLRQQQQQKKQNSRGIWNILCVDKTTVLHPATNCDGLHLIDRRHKNWDSLLERHPFSVNEMISTPLGHTLNRRACGKFFVCVFFSSLPWTAIASIQLPHVVESVLAQFYVIFFSFIL